MATFAIDLLGKTGQYVTHGSGSIVRQCKVFAYIPSGVSAHEVILEFIDNAEASKGRIVWKSVVDVSGAHRYLIVTPQLTATGEVSKTGNQIIMAPNKYVFERYFTPDQE